MADEKGLEKAEKMREDRAREEGIEPADPRKTPAVQTVTENVTHPADADSTPGPYVVDGEPMPINRPGVSTNRPDVPIADSLVAGAGAPTGPPEYDPSNPNQMPSTAFVNDRDRAAGNVVEITADKDGNVTVDVPDTEVFGDDKPKARKS